MTELEEGATGLFLKRNAAPLPDGLALHLHGEGADLGEALESAASHLAAELGLQVADGPGTEIELICYGKDELGLFLSWIEMLLYVMGARQVMMMHPKVSIQGGDHLRAQGAALSLLGPALHWPRSILAESAYARQDPSGRWQVGCPVIWAEGHGPAAGHPAETSKTRGLS